MNNPYNQQAQIQDRYHRMRQQADNERMAQEIRSGQELSPRQVTILASIPVIASVVAFISDKIK